MMQEGKKNGIPQLMDNERSNEKQNKQSPRISNPELKGPMAVSDFLPLPPLSTCCRDAKECSYNVIVY